jgi:hypothetical protein
VKIAMRKHALLALGLAVSVPAAARSATPEAVSGASARAAVAANDIIGRWDLTVQGANGPHPSWVEVELSGNSTLVGRFVSQFGSARPVAKVAYAADGTYSFEIPPQWEGGAGNLMFEGRLDGGKLTGFITEPNGTRAPFTGVRAPDLRHAEPKWGKPVAIFNGKDLDGWEAMGATNQWTVVNGILTSPKPGSNLRTKATYTDFKLHVEFRVPANGNSGLYLRGRHEVQIEDSKGLDKNSHHEGGVYGFLTPNENAAGAPGEWQTYDITLVGRLVTVTLNGKTVIRDQEIPGPTGGAMDSNEGEPGPLYLQGDHKAIEYRKIVMTTPRS